MFHDPNSEGPPCKNLEGLLQQMADGRLRGIKKWYIAAHAARCSHCGNFLQRLQLTLKAATAKPTTNQDSLERLRAQIQELEAKG